MHPRCPTAILIVNCQNYTVKLTKVIRFHITSTTPQDPDGERDRSVTQPVHCANFATGNTALGNHNITTSRQKGADKAAKAAEVKAVGATGKGGEARVAGEGGGCGAGRVDRVEGRERGESVDETASFKIFLRYDG
ncbi:uncharacterized protein BcabD6B2_41770 [Babesia caballi]|uniref:Uncharacterized protein n=1 Tax=Babesia caballi TaxID=5871 RepID=A0AAV4LY49_BABCB|nr:hypothetical protein, conserved [Babesia caballi]